MSTSVAYETGEAAILVRLFEEDRGHLTPEAARYFLHMDFPPSDRERLDALAAKARQGILTAFEQEELEHYCHVGDLLALMQSKARLVLKESHSKH
jgi:hypothetical protein